MMNQMIAPLEPVQGVYWVCTNAKVGTKVVAVESDETLGGVDKSSTP